jgi:hypothetical protein
VELALVARELWTRKRWLAVGIAVSFIAAMYSIYQVHLSRPFLVQRDLQYSSASIQAYVDSPHSFVGDLTDDLSPAIDRATAFANLMASPGAMDLVGRIAGIPGDEIWAAGPVDPTQQRVVVEPTTSKRSYQVFGESLPYRIEFLSDPNLPVISIYTQAPTTAQALALANASVAALTTYVNQLQAREVVPAPDRVLVRTIGPASGGIVNGGIRKKVAGLVFIAVFLGWCVLMLVCARLRNSWLRIGRVSKHRAALNEREDQMLLDSWTAIVPRDDESHQPTAGDLRIPAHGGMSTTSAPPPR